MIRSSSCISSSSMVMVTRCMERRLCKPYIRRGQPDVILFADARQSPRLLRLRARATAGAKAQARPDWDSPSGPREIDAGWMGAHAPITTFESSYEITVSSDAPLPHDPGGPRVA